MRVVAILLLTAFDAAMLRMILPQSHLTRSDRWFFCGLMAAHWLFFAVTFWWFTF